MSDEFDESIKLTVKRKSYQGLSGGKYQQYIEQTSVEVGGIWWHKVITKDLFSITSEYHFNC